MEVKEIVGQELLKKYEVVISSHAVDKFINDKAAEVAKTAKIDGFRAGKVPASIIKARYIDSLKSDVLQHFMDEAAKDITNKNNFSLASAPNVDAIKFEDHQDLSFNIEFELLPQIPQINYKDIKLPKYVCDGNYEKPLADAKQRLQKRYEKLVSLSAGTEAHNGHTVLIDIKGTADGISEPIVNNDVKLELGSKSFIDGFEEGMVGSKVGDVKTLNLVFPEKYHTEKFSGKKVAFVVTVKDVLESVKPEFNDTFAMEVQLENAAKLEEEIKKQIIAEFQNITESILTKELFDHLDEAIQVSLPPKLLEAELKSLENNLSQHEGSKKLAARRVKLGLILASVIKDQNIKASNEDVQKEVIKLVMNGSIPQESISEFFKDKRRADAIKQRVLEARAIQFLLNSITTQDQQVSSEELQNKVQAIG